MESENPSPKSSDKQNFVDRIVARWDGIRKTKRWVYYGSIALAWLFGDSIKSWILSILQVGWVMKTLIVLLAFLPLGLLLFLEFRAARRKAIQISWTGWVIAVCLLLDIGWNHFSHSKSGVKNSNPQPIAPITEASIAQTSNTITMIKAGISDPIHPHQRLNATFADMSFSVYDVAKDTGLAQATITWVIGDGKSHQIGVGEGHSICTNVVNGKTYIATVDSVRDEEPVWIKINVSQK